jgi:hypothetical protein
MAYRILSLDGGGTWAMLQAMALRRLYPGKRGHAVLSDFDMVAANSGGSIVLAGLADDRPLDEIVALFRDREKRRSIFVKKGLPSPTSLFGLGPKYNASKKGAGLHALLGQAGQTTMDALAARLPNGPNGETVRLLITAFDYDTSRSEFFRTFPTHAGSGASRIKLADAVHASTNAPVNYFDEPALVGVPNPNGNGFTQRRYWDGAIGGYNNPLLAAVVEALSDPGTPGPVHARSLGTATVRLAPFDAEPLPADPELRLERSRPKLFADLKKVASSINDDPPDAATYSAFVVLGNDPAVQTDGGSLVRLSPSIQPVFDNGRWRPPTGFTAAQIRILCGLGMDAVEDDKATWIERLGQHWIDGDFPNQPIRYGANLSCKIGSPTFAHGAARW